MNKGDYRAMIHDISEQTKSKFGKSWLHKFDVSDVWNKEIPIHEKAKEISRRLKDQFPDDDELFYIADELGDQTTTKGFDYLWNAVYDWADVNRVWINI